MEISIRVSHGARNLASRGTLSTWITIGQLSMTGTFYFQPLKMGVTNELD